MLFRSAGILMEVMAVLSELKNTITNINAKVQEDTKNVSINVTVDIRDISQLDFVMTKLRRIDVYKRQRVSTISTMMETIRCPMPRTLLPGPCA